MFGFIKNLFGGIFGFVGRLLGLKKSEYFLDLDGSPAKESAKAEPAKAMKPEPAKAQSSVAIAAPAKPEPAKAQSLVAVAAPAKVESASSDKKAEQVSAKAEKAKNSKKENQPAPKPTIASTNGKVPTQSTSVMTFAPDYLMPTPTANRRLPGPSMNNFRDMARQMKTAK